MMLHLRAAGVSLVLDARGPSLPRVLHWGGDLGNLSDAELAALVTVAAPPGPNAVEQKPEASVLPEGARGWKGRPGLSGHRDGRHWSPLLRTVGLRVDVDDAGGGIVVAEALDEVAGLAVGVEIELTPQGLVRTRARLTSTASDDPFTVDDLVLVHPDAVG